MKAKKKPTGYVAMCQCGVIVGAIDMNATDRKDAGRLLGEWVSDGCVLTPQFSGSWSAAISPCECETQEAA